MRVLKFSAFILAVAILAVAASLYLSVSAQADCVAKGMQGQKEIVGYDAGVDLVSATNYVPAGTTSEFGLNTPYDAKIPYSGRIESDFDKSGVGKSFLTIERRSLSISRIADDHPLVKNGLVDKGDTLVTIDIPSDIARWRDQARIYVYACPAGGGGSPSAVSATIVRVSPTLRSIGIAVLFVVIAYILCALTAKSIDPSNVLNHGWTRYLDPVYMTAGSDGRGSLSKLQILFFSTIVFGILTYIFLRTGILSDLSKTILTLLDVYRYQNCIFSVVVGLSLLFVGVTELSSFAIPDTLLGVLGLSQVVYVAGKLVTPPSFSDLNDSADALRTLETRFFEAATTTPDPTPPPNTLPTDPPQTLDAAIRRAGRDKYNAFRKSVEDLKAEFTAVIGQPPMAGADMELQHAPRRRHG